jgi:hypothetical protein
MNLMLPVTLLTVNTAESSFVPNWWIKPNTIGFHRKNAKEIYIENLLFYEKSL